MVNVDVTDGFIEIEDFLQDAQEFLADLQEVDDRLNLAPVLLSLSKFKDAFDEFVEAGPPCEPEDCPRDAEVEEEEMDLADAVHDAVHSALERVLGYVPSYVLDLRLAPEAVH